jgi:hypothetical protein
MNGFLYYLFSTIWQSLSKQDISANSWVLSKSELNTIVSQSNLELL